MGEVCRFNALMTRGRVVDARAPAMSEEDAPSVDAVAPVAALLRSDDDSQRAEGAAQLRALASDPRCDAR